MALFDFFKPRWKSKNPEVRLAAVRAPGGADLATLKDLASDDADGRVRLAAVERIADRQTLEELERGNLPPEVAEVVRGKVEVLLFEAALGGAEGVLPRIGNPSLLERLAVEAPSPALRVGAVERISDPLALGRVLERNCGKEAARAAVAKIDDEGLLARLARTGASKVTRRLAEEKLSARAAEREAPALRARRDQELDGLLAEAEKLASAPDLAAASARLASLRLAWDERDAGRSDARWPTFLSAARRVEELREEERRRQEVERLRRVEERRRQDEERHRQEQEARRARAAAPAAAPADGGADRAPGSEPPRAAATPGLERAESEILAQGEALCAELEALAEVPGQAAAGRRLREIRDAWRKLPAPGGGGPLAQAERFRAAEERLASRVEAAAQEQEWLRWNNKTLKEGLCAEAEGLEAEEDVSALADRVKDLQRRWKEVGPAPRADAGELWARFKAACDRSFERARPHLEELERRRAEAAERKEALCREAEGHAESTDWKESAEALKRAQAAWREAGPPLGRRREAELYARFRQSCDRFFERRQAHLAGLDEARRGSQVEKERLCERAEALAAAPERGRIRAVREVQAEWKKAGPAPRAAERALWERFRAACDRFFEGLDGDRGENLRQKEALCAELETLLAAGGAGGGRGEAPPVAGEFRRRWDEIGPVPFEDAEALWDRFQALCDAYAAAGHGEGEAAGQGGPSPESGSAEPPPA